MTKKVDEMVEIAEASSCLIDQLDHYFKEACAIDAIRLKLAVIHKMEAIIRYDRRVEEKKKFVQYEFSLQEQHENRKK